MNRRRLEATGGICTSGEIPHVLQLSRQRVAQLRKDLTFPRPHTRTVTGLPIWRVRDLRTWDRKRRS